jgi:hypothetical protein
MIDTKDIKLTGTITGVPAEIERLKAENAALRVALQGIVDAVSWEDDEGLAEHVDLMQKARAALGGVHARCTESQSGPLAVPAVRERQL